MPRKTRKQKQKSRERKIAQIEKNNEVFEPVKRNFKFEFKNYPQDQLKKFSTNKVDKSLLLQDTKPIFKDLVKTMVLAIIIFSLETVIYFAWFK